MNIITGNNKTLCDYDVYKVFYLAHEVMTALIPSTNTIEDDYRIWFKAFHELRTNTIYILLKYKEDLKGYIAYSIIEKTIIIEDLIVSPNYQGDGKTVAVLLYEFFKHLNDDIELIRVYTNKRNLRMQKLLSKIGFTIDRITDRGIKYSIPKKILRDKFSLLLSHLGNNKSV